MYRKQDLAYKLFFKALEHDSIQELAEAAHYLLDYPVLVNDNLGNKICQVPSEEIGDPDWDYLLRYGHTESGHYRDFFKKYMKHPEQKHYPLDIVDGNDIKKRQLFSCIHINGVVLYYSAFLIGDKEYTENDFQIVKLFNRMLSIMMRQKANINNEIYLKSIQAFSALLENKAEKQEELLRNTQMLELRYVPEYVLCVIELMDNDINPAYLCQDIVREYAPVLAAPFRNHVVILCSDLANHSMSDSLEKIRGCMSGLEYCVGTSPSFSCLRVTDIQTAYEQAKITLNYGKTVNGHSDCHNYEDYVPFQYLYAIQKLPLAVAFKHKKLLAIQEYDAANNTDYLKTIKHYLMFMMDTKTVSETLHLHKNSLLYRIKRIEELFDIDFHDYRENLHMLISSMIMDE